MPTSYRTVVRFNLTDEVARCLEDAADKFGSVNHVLTL